MPRVAVSRLSSFDGHQIEMGASLSPTVAYPELLGHHPDRVILDGRPLHQLGKRGCGVSRALAGGEDDTPISSRPPRTAPAIVIASQASWGSGGSEVAAASRRREYRWITVARFSVPLAVGISVMSPHTWGSAHTR